MEPAIDAAAIVREAKPFPVRAASNWSVPSFTKVIGFRFQEPEGHDDRDEFSLLGAVLEDKELQHCAVSGKALTNGQVDRLLAGAFTSGFVDGDAACYDPHHIFVFYAEGGRAVGAIEVCFECVRVVEWPHKGTYDDTRGHHDLSILAQLCWELGIWRGPETNLKDYYDKLSQLRKER